MYGNQQFEIVQLWIKADLECGYLWIVILSQLVLRPGTARNGRLILLCRHNMTFCLCRMNKVISIVSQ